MRHSPGVVGFDYGWIVADSGNMYGGKTTSFIARVEQFERIENARYEAAKREGTKFERLTVGVFKPTLDDRYSVHEISSHDGKRLPATPISTIDDLIHEVEKHNYRVVAIDEIQFFNEKNKDDEFYRITHVLKRFADEKRYVLVAGLDKDFRGLPFGPMGEILALSDERYYHDSVCVMCGSTATLPQRFVNGSPAFYEDPVVVVGAKEAYEPRCRNCHEVPAKESVSTTRIS